MENDIGLANTKALAKPSKVHLKRNLAPTHDSRLEANEALKNDRSLDALTLEFQSALKKGVEGIIDAGKVLIRAKDQLKKQNARWEEWIIRELRFGERARNGKANLRKAQQLMLLARHSVIASPTNWHTLPPSIRTLTELSQIPNEDLLEHIENGVVHAGMTRNDAARLKPSKPKPDPKDPALAPTLREEIKTLFEFCLNVGRPDIIRAYQRGLKSEPGLPSKEDFDRAVQFAEQIYKAQGGR